MSRAVEFRRATAEDAAAIRELTRAAYARWVPLIGREPMPMTADYEAAVRDHRFDLLFVDGTLAGLVETIDEGEVLLVQNVAIAPALQGQGLGRMLMGMAEAVARELGRRRMRLFTNQRFAANVRLYQSLGYAIDREEASALGVTTYMSKALA